MTEALKTSIEELKNSIQQLSNDIQRCTTLLETPRNTITYDEPKPVQRLNYIGSKFQLLDWLHTTISQKTGWSSFRGKRVADLFAGTGIVSWHFRNSGAVVISNDAELYSSIITKAFTTGCYTPKLATLIPVLNKELDEEKYSETVGSITTHYSPFAGNARKFFTIDNGRRIDYLRTRIEDLKSEITSDEYTFLLASLILAADAVSNVPAVYGCFLKAFKAKALKQLRLRPIHESAFTNSQSKTTQSDVLSPTLLASFRADCVYLDPPYNERQYSKNYFPLNLIAKPPSADITLKGVTGIPSDCFLSPFCQKGSVLSAFETLFRDLRTEWIFLSYNSESLVPKEILITLMKRYGTVTVVERNYKRFKSYEYNEDKEIQEYLFCIHKTT